jgi:hypothetical protein
VIYAKLAAALALLAAIGWGVVADYHAGKKAGSDAVQAAWDKDKASIQAVADAAIATATKERDAALEANEAVSNDYQTQLSAARALSGSLAAKLRDYAARTSASGGGVSKAGSGQGTAGTSTPSGDAGLTNALGAALAECSANTAQLDALIVEIKPQIQ